MASVQGIHFRPVVPFNPNASAASNSSASRALDPVVKAALVALVIAIIGAIIYFIVSALMNSGSEKKESKKNTSPVPPPINPAPICPPPVIRMPTVCNGKSEMGVSSIIAISPNEFKAPLHSMPDSGVVEIDCKGCNSFGFVLPQEDSSPYATIKTSRLMAVSPVDSLAPWTEIKQGVPVNITSCAEGPEGKKMGASIVSVDAKTRTFRIRPDGHSKIRAGDSGAKVDIVRNGTPLFAGTVEACPSKDGYNCTDDVQVVRPDSIAPFTRPEDNLPLGRKNREEKDKRRIKNEVIRISKITESPQQRAHVPKTLHRYVSNVAAKEIKKDGIKHQGTTLDEIPFIATPDRKTAKSIGAVTTDRLVTVYTDLIDPPLTKDNVDTLHQRNGVLVYKINRDIPAVAVKITGG